VRSRSEGLYSALDKSAYQLEASHLFFRDGSQLPDFLHQRLYDRHLFIDQCVRPRYPRPKGIGGTKLFNPEVLASDGLVPGIEPSCPLARVVLRRPQPKIFDIRVHRAVETAGLII
jgi:hypothetical protein